jgi:hypothetical protein
MAPIWTALAGIAALVALGLSIWNFWPAHRDDTGARRGRGREMRAAGKSRVHIAATLGVGRASVARALSKVDAGASTDVAS